MIFLQSVKKFHRLFFIIPFKSPGSFAFLLEEFFVKGFFPHTNSFGKIRIGIGNLALLNPFPGESLYCPERILFLRYVELFFRILFQNSGIGKRSFRYRVEIESDRFIFILDPDLLFDQYNSKGIYETFLYRIFSIDCFFGDFFQLRTSRSK